MTRVWRTLLVLIVVVLPIYAYSALPPSPASHTLLVIPFENASKAPGIEWIGEAFPQVIIERLSGPDLYVISRDDRVYAFDHVGLPANLKPSRATVYRMAEQMDADYVVFGRYSFDGQAFTAFAQVLDMHRLRLGPQMIESGTLPNLMDVANGIAWQVLRSVDPEQLPTRAAFLGTAPAVRLDAFENYIRGVTASTRPEKLRRLREALRITPQYDLANFQLGRAYFDARDYQNALMYLNKVPRSASITDEANFYAGLAAYYLGDLARAEDALSFVSVRLPLPEVDNNLGVVLGRRGKGASAVQYLQKAVQADPNDADYRYNLSAIWYRNGNTNEAARQLREALALRPGDTDAKSLLDTITSGRTYAAATPSRSLGERIKRNYDEASFRQLALEIENATEMRLAKSDPPTHARAHVERGRDLLNRGLATEAEKQFREAVKLDPNNAAAHVGWAAALEQTGDFSNSRAEAGKALDLEKSPEAYVTLARLDMRDGNLRAASTNIQNALALQPNNTAALVLQHEIANRNSTATASAQKQ